VLLGVPFQVLIVPLFIVVRSVPFAGGNDWLGQGGTGWINTWWALIIPFVSAPLYVFLARQFFVSLPPDLADAARVDGLGEIVIFFRIMAPLARPAFVTIALFNRSPPGTASSGRSSPPAPSSCARCSSGWRPSRSRARGSRSGRS
jgi:multiple sugar transport system permease protein